MKMFVEREDHDDGTATWFINIHNQDRLWFHLNEEELRELINTLQEALDE